jgi:hypothetical protein
MFEVMDGENAPIIIMLRVNRSSEIFFMHDDVWRNMIIIIGANICRYHSRDGDIPPTSAVFPEHFFIFYRTSLLLSFSLSYFRHVFLFLFLFPHL